MRDAKHGRSCVEVWLDYCDFRHVYFVKLIDNSFQLVGYPGQMTCDQVFGRYGDASNYLLAEGYKAIGIEDTFDDRIEIPIWVECWVSDTFRVKTIGKMKTGVYQVNTASGELTLEYQSDNYMDVSIWLGDEEYSRVGYKCPKTSSCNTGEAKCL